MSKNEPHVHIKKSYVLAHFFMKETLAHFLTQNLRMMPASALISKNMQASTTHFVSNQQSFLVFAIDLPDRNHDP